MLPAVNTRLAAALNVRPGEVRLVVLLMLLFFMKGICDVFFATSASALFLRQYGSASLPYVYIASAGAVTLLGLAYSHLSTRLTIPALFRLIVVFSIATIGLFHFLLSGAQSGWPVMGLMMWREVVYMLLNVTCWAQAALLFDVRQGKRLFPLLSAGDLGSSAIGGIAIPFVVGHIGPLHLLYFAEVSIALCLIVSVYIGRAAIERGAGSSQNVSAESEPILKLLRERYVALFFGLSLVSYVIFFLADYNFYGVVNNRYQGAESLAAFFGVFYAVLNGLNFVLNAVSGRVLTRYGIQAGLLVVPVCVGACTIAAIVLPMAGVAGGIFWAVVVTKLMDEMLRGAFLIPTVKILYLPLPERRRIRVQAVRESIVEPGAIGLSGVLLLVLTRLAGLEIPQLLWVLLIILTAFVTLSVLLRREYVSSLGKGLPGQAKPDEPRLSFRYKDADAVQHDLESSNPNKVIDCFRMIERTNQAAANVLLPKILKHALPEVRIYALQRIRRTIDIRATDLVRSLIEREESPDVKAEALSTLSVLTGGHESK